VLGESQTLNAKYTLQSYLKTIIHIYVYIYIYMHKFNYNKNKKRKHSLIFLKEIKEYNKTEPIVYHLQ